MYFKRACNIGIVLIACKSCELANWSTCYNQAIYAAQVIISQDTFFFALANFSTYVGTWKWDFFLFAEMEVRFFPTS